jgi:hypothetical protein
VVHAYSPRTWETVAREPKLKASLGCRVRPISKKEKTDIFEIHSLR